MTASGAISEPSVEHSVRDRARSIADTFRDMEEQSQEQPGTPSAVMEPGEDDAFSPPSPGECRAACKRGREQVDENDADSILGNTENIEGKWRRSSSRRRSRKASPVSAETFEATGRHENDSGLRDSGLREAMHKSKTDIDAHWEEYWKDEVIVPPEAVGFVIGRQGETIKSITIASGAIVSMDRSFPGPSRRFAISGRPDQVRHCRDMILSKLDEIRDRIRDNRSGSTSVGASKRLSSDSQGHVIEKDDSDESYELWLPVEKIGLIIGAGGATIRMIKEESGAIATVHNDRVDGGRKLLMIKGQRSSIERARDVIQDIMTGSTSRGYQGDNNCGPFRNLAHSMHNHHAPDERHREQYDEGDISAHACETKAVYIPSTAVGLVIGRFGLTLRDLQTKSGASIKVMSDEEAAGSSERLITISGTPDVIERAHTMLDDVIQDRFMRTEGEFTTARHDFRKKSGKLFKKQEVRRGLEEKFFPLSGEHIGLLIGKNGMTIKDIQQRSGAQIEVTGKNEAERNSEFRTVTIVGTAAEVSCAKIMIDDKLTNGRDPMTARGLSQSRNRQTIAEPSRRASERLWRHNAGDRHYDDREAGEICPLDGQNRDENDPQVANAEGARCNTGHQRSFYADNNESKAVIVKKAEHFVASTTDGPGTVVQLSETNPVQTGLSEPTLQHTSSQQHVASSSHRTPSHQQEASPSFHPCPTASFPNKHPSYSYVSCQPVQMHQPTPAISLQQATASNAPQHQGPTPIGHQYHAPTPTPPQNNVSASQLTPSAAHAPVSAAQPPPPPPPPHPHPYYYYPTPAHAPPPGHHVVLRPHAYHPYGHPQPQHSTPYGVTAPPPPPPGFPIPSPNQYPYYHHIQAPPPHQLDTQQPPPAGAVWPSTPGRQPGTEAPQSQHTQEPIAKESSGQPTKNNEHPSGLSDAKDVSPSTTVQPVVQSSHPGPTVPQQLFYQQPPYAQAVHHAGYGPPPPYYGYTYPQLSAVPGSHPSVHPVQQSPHTVGNEQKGSPAIAAVAPVVKGDKGLCENGTDESPVTSARTALNGSQ